MSAKRRERVIFSSTPGTAPENTALHDSDRLLSDSTWSLPSAAVLPAGNRQHLELSLQNPRQQGTAYLSQHHAVFTDVAAGGKEDLGLEPRFAKESLLQLEHGGPAGDQDKRILQKRDRLTSGASSACVLPRQASGWEAGTARKISSSAMER